MSESSGELRIEATGETVGEAKWSALRELERRAPGLDKTAVHFEVLSEGERGLLGVGYMPARVVATVPLPPSGPAEPPPEPGGTPLAEDARQLVARIAAVIGVECRVDVRESADTIDVSCSGPDLGLLIGRRGQTIDAIQYLVNAIAFRSHPDPRKDVVVDAAGYRERRRRSLEALAVRSAELAVAREQRVELDPMTAVERKVVHLRLKEFPGVATSSEGTEPNRFVVIEPARD
ncbi:MAG TPA: RNA-binding cell elongation regulator Jag/EloR [Gaiellaceae bacterium]|jgi:spoIIIJ-associated protein